MKPRRSWTRLHPNACRTARWLLGAQGKKIWPSSRPTGRQRINIHGAIDLETGQTRTIEAETIDAASTIRPLEAIEALYPLLAMIDVYLDNATRYHHAKLAPAWLDQPGRRIKLHFIPPYCPHLNPIERLRGVTHKQRDAQQVLRHIAGVRRGSAHFLTRESPAKRAELCDSVTDNFRVINPKDFRVLA